MNPFLQKNFHIRWSQLNPVSVVDGIEIALKNAKNRLEAYEMQDRGKLSFDSVVIALDEVTEELDWAWGLVQHLDNLCNGEELRAVYHQMLPAVSAFYSLIPLNEQVWDILSTYACSDEAKQLIGVKSRALNELLEGFRRQGAELHKDQKKRFEEVSAELALLTQKYSENVLDSTKQWEKIVADEAMLAGLPKSALDAAKVVNKNEDGSEAVVYKFTLKAPSMLPVLEFAENVVLREEVWRAAGTVGFGGQYDNTEIIAKILNLRREKASLLGKSTFADYVTERRMAKSGKNALNFIEKLFERCQKAFEKETIELQEFRADLLGQKVEVFEPWDLAFWAEKQRKALYDFDTEELRPYFSMDKVIGGMFELAELLFELKINERETVYLKDSAEGGVVSTKPNEQGLVEVWHPEVKFFEVRNNSGVHIGSFYTDWHPRDSKRGGAWMNHLQMGTPPVDGRDRRLHLGLICGNMSAPSGGKPALLTHDEVCTVFHEFGHLLHQLCGNVEIASLNGVNVSWDFVELPSQLMENFCWERKSLDQFARHFETGKKIPQKLFKKMIAAMNFRSASTVVRQLSLAKMDLELHILQESDSVVNQLDEWARQLLKSYMIPVKTQGPSIARRFGHLFSSAVGYAAGYYSYKWAEVLDADAFTRFQKEGVMSAEVGKAFRDCILSRGNAEDPQVLFRDFMGRDPDPNALLVRAGID
jgi:oligopeptidase A